MKNKVDKIIGEMATSRANLRQKFYVFCVDVDITDTTVVYGTLASSEEEAKMKINRAHIVRSFAGTGEENDHDDEDFTGNMELLKIAPAVPSDWQETETPGVYYAELKSVSRRDGSEYLAYTMNGRRLSHNYLGYE
jgi:hypothetical protein